MTILFPKKISSLTRMRSKQRLEAVRQENGRLKTLVSSFSSVNSSLDLKTVLTESLRAAKELLNAEIASLALLSEKKDELIFRESTDPAFDKLKKLKVPVGIGISGMVAKTGKSICVEDVRKDDQFYNKIDQVTGYRTVSYLCAPLFVNNKIIGTTQIMNHRDGRLFGKKDLELLEGFANQAALAINNARIHELMLEQKEMEDEMKLCVEIQKNIFLSKSPHSSYIQFYAHSLPAREVGGDYYSYLEHDRQCIDTVIADISGKGLSASIIVTELHTAYKLLSSPSKPLEQTIKELNTFLCDNLLPGRFISGFFTRIYPDTKEVQYVLAGHPPPFLLRENGSCENLERTGQVLGIDPNASPRQGSFVMEPNDLLLAFSDGYSEAQNQQGDFFGEERILKAVNSNRAKNLSTIHQLIEKDVNKFRANHPLSDDTTILMIRRK